MNERALKLSAVVSLVFAFGGLGYFLLFSNSNSQNIGGIQLSPPGESLQKYCENEVFIQCLPTSEDFVCDAMRRGVSSDGSNAIVGSTLCKYVKCIC